MKTSMRSMLMALTFLSLAVGPKAQAVSPPPDGGYPGGNTAEGQNALLSLTSGTFNTAVGFLSLRSDTEGQFNTAVGAGALLANEGRPTTNLGIENTAVGAGALLSNTTASFNTADGAFALLSNTTGGGNTANGFQALHNNTQGGGNAALGINALLTNSTGFSNTAVGNTALGSNTTGSGNTALGFGAGGAVTTASNVICIGAEGNNVDNSCFIGNIFDATNSNGVAVLVNSNGRLGTATSSRRFKGEIKPMQRSSEVLFALKPVTFRYKKGIDPQGIAQFGLVAEGVEKVNPDLVVRDKEGKPYSVRYDQVNAMLLNEFLKEHEAFIEEQHKVEKLEATVASLVATVKEQSAQIQKVSAHVELSEAAPLTAVKGP
jgi:trimeric autotransporter adhesin